ncbi:MAG: DUF4199 family protein [Thermonemataceae bacterium]
MKHPYFKTLIAGCLAGGALISVFLIILSFVYKDPLNATPKALDFLLYIGISVGTVAYYKVRISGGYLKFIEGLVMVSLVNAAMVLLASITLWLLIEAKPTILQNNTQALLDNYVTNKEEIMKKVQSEEDYQRLLARTEQRTVGIVLFEEAGLKLMVGFFTSIVAATALRK